MLPPLRLLRPRWWIALVLLLAMVLALPHPSPDTGLTGLPADGLGSWSVIVRLDPDVDARRLVEGLGGRVQARLGIISGVVAELPARAVPLLARTPGVRGVTPDARLRLSSVDYDAAKDLGSMVNVGRLIEADYLWERGITGAGVGVALIDSGIVPVEGLHSDVVHGPDLSFEGWNGALRTLDTYGHGTHMAGIIAGRDEDWGPSSTTAFAGVAPDARLVSVKVADAAGNTDVSQVIAAIDWVVQHRDEMDIRVLNLSFGTDGAQSYQLDPLAYAVEVAWRKGIVVVAAAGNGGLDDGRLNNPAYDPYVVAVGAVDPRATKPTHDDEIPMWSSRGDGQRNPDLVAPGRSIVSLRDRGSTIDRGHPTARLGERFFRGSGTSQAASVVSGAAALLLQQRPSLTPDELKQLLRSTAVHLPAADPRGQGEGLLNVKHAAQGSAAVANQTHPKSLGLGLLEAARGSVHLGDGVTTLTGEVDASGEAWEAAGWTLAASGEVTWSGGSWAGDEWTGGHWSGNKWADDQWSGNKWAEQEWTGTWTGNKWADQGWPADDGAGRAWSSASWK